MSTKRVFFEFNRGGGGPSLLWCASTGAEFKLGNSWGNTRGNGEEDSVIRNRLTSLAWEVHVPPDETSWGQGRLSKATEQEEVPRVAGRAFDKHFSVHV